MLADLGDAPVFTAIAYPGIIVTTKRAGDAPADSTFRALTYVSGTWRGEPGRQHSEAAVRCPEHK